MINNGVPVSSGFDREPQRDSIVEEIHQIRQNWLDDFAVMSHAALDLDDRQREELVGLLIESLDHVDEIDRAWMAEARRRYEAVRSGKARTLSNDEVVARLEACYG